MEISSNGSDIKSGRDLPTLVINSRLSCRMVPIDPRDLIA